MWSFVHTVLLLSGLCIPAVDHDALNTEGKKHRLHLLYEFLQQASSSLCLVSSRCILGTETSFSTETDFWVTGSRMEDRVDKGAQIREMRKHLPWGLGLSQYVVQWYTLAALTPQRWFKQISQHNIKSEQFPCGVVVVTLLQSSILKSSLNLVNLLHLFCITPLRPLTGEMIYYHRPLY